MGSKVPPITPIRATLTSYNWNVGELKSWKVENPVTSTDGVSSPTFQLSNLPTSQSASLQSAGPHSERAPTPDRRDGSARGCARHAAGRYAPTPRRDGPLR